MELKTLKWRKTEEIDHDYVVFLPDSYERSKNSWPLLFYIGGTADAEVYKTLLTPVRDKPWIVATPIMPPIPEDMPRYQVDWNQKILGTIIRKIIEDYRVDKNHVVLMGFSMGGSQAWQLPFWHQDLFAKVAVISGGCHPWYSKHYPKIPVRVFSGADEEFFPHHTHCVNCAKSYGIDIEHTIWPDTGHGGCLNKTIRHESLIWWLLEK